MTTTVKLTRDMRDAFVNACMSDVPKPDYPALVKEAQDIFYKVMSPAVRKVFREEPEALRYEMFQCLADRGQAKLVLAGLDWRLAEEVLHKAEARNRVRSQVRQVAYACKTAKQLAEMLPQFAHHVPKAYESPAGLPVSASLLDDLVILGFQAKSKAGE